MRGFYWGLRRARSAIVPTVILLTALGGCSEFAPASGVGADITGAETIVADGDEPNDVLNDSNGTPDSVVVVDSWDPDTACPGCPGSLCDDNIDCNSGFCIDGPGGSICTDTCIEDCPEGFSCRPVAIAGDPTYICVYEHVPYCRPCNLDSDCAHPYITGAGALCIDGGDGAGSFCATPCPADACPEGAYCDKVPIEGEIKDLCRPLPQTECSCSTFATEAAASTTCLNVGEAGACEGVRQCTSAGLSECDAPIPEDELCNGVDDDCDGAVDETFASKGEPCDGDDADACADGTFACQADGTMACEDDPTSQVEICNDIDDDCDGETDEQYTDKGTPCDGNDVDLCADGLWVCDAAGSVTCDDDEQSVVESCNGLDDDCDGETDEDFPAVGQACDGDDPDACKLGTWTCAADGSGEVVCENEGEGTQSLTDFDGTTGLMPGDSCGVGPCAGGIVTCDASGELTCTTYDQASPEICDAADNDCDGDIDEDFSVLSVGGQPLFKGAACGVGACVGGQVVCSADTSKAVCSSASAAVAETCDGVDNDCDGGTDEDFGPAGTVTFIDGDGTQGLVLGDACGAGSCSGGVVECGPGGGLLVCTTSQVASDELCDGLDNDCDGVTDELYGAGGTVNYVGPEGAVAVKGQPCGVGVCTGGTVVCAADNVSLTCTTAAAAQSDTCDQLDNDCDGETDEDYKSGGSVSYDDLSGATELVLGDACGAGACEGGLVACAAGGQLLTCTNLPAGAEICDDVDNDCDGDVDEGCDVDNDDYCDAAKILIGAPAVCPNGGGDCDDGEPSTSPGAEDICDGLDNNCSGGADEGCDDDGDEYCEMGMTVLPGAVCEFGGGDCNDDAGAINPAATEVCDDIDNNCVVGADEGCNDDSDAYCDDSMVTIGTPDVCPAGGGDCDDGATDINPGSVDVCDNVDNDCSGAADDAFVDGTITYDGDPSGPGLVKGDACGSGACLGGVVICTLDQQALACSSETGGNAEVCDDADNDCNGSTDEGCDDDGDGFCDAAMQIVGTPAVCPNGGGDCDDEALGVNPPAVDICDGVDNDCEGGTDEDFSELGGGCSVGQGECTAVGTVVCSGDGSQTECSATPSPDTDEICDGLDNDCDGVGDNNLVDAPPCALTVGVCSNSVQPCVLGGYEPCGASIYGADYEAVESACDGLDNDCDGLTDLLDSSVSAPLCSLQLGVCAGSVQACAGAAGWKACAPADYGLSFSETNESGQCDGLDNDCDGTTDEEFPQLGDVCEVGEGECKAFGTIVCTADGVGTVCSANQGTPELEICDGLDNNCQDGVDEGCDDDNDNYCDAQMTVTGTPAVCPNGGGDCDDDAGLVYPGLTEVCDNIDNNCAGGTDEGCDSDGDDYCDVDMTVVGLPLVCPHGGGDCADEVSAINPGETEVCDGDDNNCAAGVDEGCDDDGDDYCDDAMTTVGLPAVCPNGGGDCADGNNAVNPAAVELCDDVDNNCSAGTDEGCDDDSDQWCDVEMSVVGNPTVCPNGGGDCRDDLGAVNPAAVEICDDLDNDCANGTDGGCDDDGDDYCDDTMTTVGAPAVCSNGAGDCDDGEPLINPSIADVCDNTDNDCSGVADQAYVVGGTVTYDDDPSGPGLVKGDSCGAGACTGGVVVCAPDALSLTCSSSGAGAGEVCDGLDNDCNDQTDEGCDDDGDGYCDAAMTIIGTPSVCPSGGDDCDDGTAGVNPGATESCDDIDNNCVVGVDEGCDDDGDGFCDATMSVSGTPQVCPNGPGDCADGNDEVQPGAAEVCDGIDNDCASGTDEGCDDDGDGYCDAAMTTLGSPPVCPNGGGDCDDGESAVNGGITEICDDVDNNCAGGIDEGCDDDNDNYCDVTMTVIGSPSTCTDGGGDCHDANGQVNPSVSVETCDNLDNDCNSLTDEGCDDDNDNYCDDTLDIVGVPATCTAGGGDCNDSSAAFNPGVVEVCDGVDQDCTGAPDDAPPASMCSTSSHSTPQCVAGACQLTCDPQWSDLNGVYSDGCECNYDNYESSGPNSNDICQFSAILGGLSDVGTSITVGGTLHSTSDVDWYHFVGDDASSNGPNDTYHVSITFQSNPNSEFRFDVLKDGSCGDNAQCLNETVYEYFTDQDNGKTNGEGDCTAWPGAPNRNICNDDTATYRVRVFRRAGVSPTCSPYVLRIRNGPLP